MKEKLRNKINDLRCSKCNKLLFKYRLQGGLRIEIKCPRCGTLTVFEVSKGVIS